MDCTSRKRAQNQSLYFIKNIIFSFLRNGFHTSISSINAICRSAAHYGEDGRASSVPGQLV